MAKRPPSRAATPRTRTQGRKAVAETAPATEARRKTRAAPAEATTDAPRGQSFGSVPTKSAKATRQTTIPAAKARGAEKARPKGAAPGAKTSKPAKAPARKASSSKTSSSKASSTKTPAAEPAASATRKSRAAKTPAIEKGAKPTAKARGAKASKRPRKVAPRKRRPPSPPYLAAELGQPLDHAGEPVGAGAALLAADRELQDYTLHLWRQMQSGRSINKHLQAVERAGLNLDDVWMVGVKETLKTTSTPDEARAYRQRLLFRANLLEAILSETVAKLIRLDHRADVGGETEAS